MRGIDDNPTGGKWQAVVFRGCRGDVGFHVHRDRRRGFAQRTFGRRLRYRGIDADDVGMDGMVNCLH